MPYAMYVLTAAPFLGALGTAVSMSFVVLVPLVCTDWLFYGSWTVRTVILCSFFRVWSASPACGCKSFYMLAAPGVKRQHS